jgi:hypothetical protein
MNTFRVAEQMYVHQGKDADSQKLCSWKKTFMVHTLLLLLLMMMMMTNVYCHNPPSYLHSE